MYVFNNYTLFLLEIDQIEVSSPCVLVICFHFELTMYKIRFWSNPLKPKLFRNQNSRLSISGKEIVKMNQSNLWVKPTKVLWARVTKVIKTWLGSVLRWSSHSWSLDRLWYNMIIVSYVSCALKRSMSTWFKSSREMFCVYRKNYVKFRGASVTGVKSIFQNPFMSSPAKTQENNGKDTIFYHTLKKMGVTDRRLQCVNFL